MRKRLITRYIIIAVYFSLLLTPFAARAERQEFQGKDILIQADALTYIPEKSLVLAIGNVEIFQNGRLLSAEEITYEQDTNIITAAGEVALLEPDGTVFAADKVELTDGLNEGVANVFQAQFTDKSRLMADRAIRVNEAITKLENATYNACQPCKGAKKTTPMWQIKSDNVTVDTEEQRVSYRNVYFEFFEVPILYTPYFSHATPDADRKSGLLRPTYSSVSTLGATAKVPYYLDIAPNMDAVISPIFTTEEGAVMSGEFRHLTENGRYQLSGSITNPDQRDTEGNKVGGSDLRGHVQGFGNFNLKDNWAWGFDGKRASDDTYLQRYKFGNEDLLTSKAYIQKIDGRDYMAAEAITFQGLNAEDDPSKTPLILPLVTSHLESKPGWAGSRWMLDSNMLALSRSEGVESRRLSVTGTWSVPYTTKNGHIFELKTSLRSDGYHVEEVPDPLDPLNNQAGFVGRVIPEAQLNWSYPMVQYNSGSHIYIEPITNFIISPNGNNPNKIPNEDSQELELSDVNLFSNNHFTGLDRVESGARANYGVRGGIYDNEGDSINFLFGQSYRAKSEESFAPESGLDENFSDYVGRISLNDDKILSLSYRFRMDKNNFLLHRNEVEAGFNLHPFALSTSYVLLDEDIASRPELDREEIAAAAAYAISDDWRISGNGRRDLSDDGGIISAGGGIHYKNTCQNDCLSFSLLLNREFIRDRDIEPSTSIIFEIGFKNLE